MNFKSLRDKYSYKPKATTYTSRKITYVKQKLVDDNLKPLPVLLANNLNLLFVGYNPSIKSSQSGHRYAHHSNLFWKLIYESKIVDEPLKPEQDYTMIEKYSIGFTDLVYRPSKSIQELSNDEMKQSVPKLVADINHYQPKVVCFVGKGIWVHLCKYLGVKREFTWGLQELKQIESKVYVVPSTSGLVRISKEDQLKLWRGLKVILQESNDNKDNDVNDVNGDEDINNDNGDEDISDDIDEDINNDNHE